MKSFYATLLVVSVVLVGVATGASGQEATFEGLGRIPGSLHVSKAFAVSADGAVVVGSDQTPEGPEAFRWENGVMVGLGEPEFELSPRVAYGVSADGSVIVGDDFGPIGGCCGEAFRWENGELEGLGFLEGGEEGGSRAYAVSSDGSVIVGGSSSANGLQAFRWEDGGMEGLGFLAGGSNSTAHATSTDGMVVVGWSSSEVNPFWQAFRWEAGTMASLGGLTGDSSFSRAYGVSGNGSVVVGESSTGNGLEAFRWIDGEMEGLGDLEGDNDFSSALAVSSDGSVVVGKGTSEDGQEAFYWTKDDGIRNLKEMLEGDYGLNLTGWTLREARDISDDGTVVVGWGYNPDGLTEAWRAFLGKPVADEATPGITKDIVSLPTPNPVGGLSTFTVAVERNQDVVIELFDLMGRRVQILYSGALVGGMSERLTLDASTLPAGVYVIRALGEAFVRTRRITVVR